MQNETYDYNKRVLGLRNERKPLPDLATLWARFAKQQLEAAEYAKEHKLYEPGNYGSIPVDRINDYHEKQLEDKWK